MGTFWVEADPLNVKGAARRSKQVELEESPVGALSAFLNCIGTATSELNYSR
ncbi:MAG: hypothetical protein ACK48X_08555 [Planctomycetota bacterium]